MCDLNCRREEFMFAYRLPVFIIINYHILYYNMYLIRMKIVDRAHYKIYFMIRMEEYKNSASI